MAKGDFAIGCLTGSTTGAPVAVAATASSGTTMHTAACSSDEIELVTMEATNIDTVDRLLYLQWGGTATVNQIGPIRIPAKRGAIVVADRRALGGVLVVRAYADVANVVNITGHIVRYTNT